MVTCPTAVVFAPPATTVTTPELSTVPASVPATPPDMVVVLPKTGMAATIPLLTSTPLPIAGIASPCCQEVLSENADPAVFISYVPTSSVAAAVAEPAVSLPICSPVETLIFVPDTA